MNPFHRKLPVGAEVFSEGTHFRVWAPKCQKVSVSFDGEDDRPLTVEPNGYFSEFFEGVGAGTSYRFRLDSSEQLYPDPASRYQSDGPSGASRIIDPSTYVWRDKDWLGPRSKSNVFYEMHNGTYTEEGTWRAAVKHLDELQEIGITCIECMPVCEFVGRFNWGYDGANLYAPTKNYGTPDDFRFFVDEAHLRGISVILDVVYNHFGAGGDFLKEFCPDYFSRSAGTDWGDALNFDGPNCAGVREYFISNARYWISEFHIDGFRFDATQNIYDASKVHILSEIASASREEAGQKRLLMIGENESQDSNLVRSVEGGGIGLDALWNDDFHHTMRVALVGKREAYLTDYCGTPQEIISSLKWGFLSQGQMYIWSKRRRGTQAFDLPPSSFLNYFQNHDQIANISSGTRISDLASYAQVKAATVVLLLSPQSPLLFQGQEFGATTPFYYFGDHQGYIAELMEKGRKKELGQFPSLNDSIAKDMVAVPSLETTFIASKLSRDQRSSIRGRQLLKLHRDLIALRNREPFLSAQSEKTIDGAVLSENALVLRFFSNKNRDVLLVVNFGNDLFPRTLSEPLFGTPMGMRWTTKLSTESVEYGGFGAADFEHKVSDPRVASSFWEIPAHSATLLELVELTAAEAEAEKRMCEEHEKGKKEFLGELAEKLNSDS